MVDGPWIDGNCGGPCGLGQEVSLIIGGVIRVMAVALFAQGCGTSMPTCQVGSVKGLGGGDTLGCLTTAASSSGGTGGDTTLPDALPCLVDGASCTEAARCCSAVCGTSGTCAAPANGCLEDLSTCSPTDHCCNGRPCVNGLCSIYEVDPNPPMACKHDSDCRGMEAYGAFCHEAVCCGCIFPGQPSLTASRCCTNKLVNGLCHDP